MLQNIKSHLKPLAYIAFIIGAIWVRKCAYYCPINPILDKYLSVLGISMFLFGSITLIGYAIDKISHTVFMQPETIFNIIRGEIFVFFIAIVLYKEILIDHAGLLNSFALIGFIFIIILTIIDLYRLGSNAISCLRNTSP